MSKLPEIKITKIKNGNFVKRSELWPHEHDEYYVTLANDQYGSEIRDNTREEKIEIGKAIENGTIDNN